MRHLGTWVSGGPVSAGGMAGLNGLRGLFQSFSGSGGNLLLSVACLSAGCKIIKKMYIIFLCRGLMLSRRPVFYKSDSQRAPGVNADTAHSALLLYSKAVSLTINIAGNLEHPVKICQ